MQHGTPIQRFGRPRRYGLVTISGESGPRPERPRDPDWNWSSESAEAWENEAELDFRLITGFEVGRALVRHLRRAVVIRPKQTTAPGMIAVTYPALGYTGLVDSTPEGAPIRYLRDNGDTPWDERGQPVRELPQSLMHGTGRGAMAFIEYTPGDWLHRNAPIPGDETYAGAVHLYGYSDAVLVHEMLHALRITHGVRHPQRFVPYLGHDYGMENTEEFYAHLVGNMYRSQRRIPLIASYTFLGTLTWRPSRSPATEPYMKLERRWMAACFRELPAFSKELSRIPPTICPYNPFRTYLTGDYRGRAPNVAPITQPVHPMPPPPQRRLMNPFE